MKKAIRLKEDCQREDYPVNNKMKCLASGCEFNTDAEIDDQATLGEKFQLMSFGRQQFETSETELLKHMEQLGREFQNQAVYKQEFLDIKQTPDVELKSKDFKIVTNK